MEENRFGDSGDDRRWRVPETRQLESDAYHIWKPRPLLRSIHWRPDPEPPRDVVATAYDVFLDQRAFVVMHDHIWKAAPRDAPFGYLVGDLCEDPDSERRYLIISGAVPSRFPLREVEAEQISGEADVALQLELDRRRGVLAGWYHAHREGPVQLSEADLATHQRMFAEPWHVALLFISDSSRPEGACFRRTNAGLSGDMQLPFYEMVSNESLLARGVRRSHLDWVNVCTEDSILPEPPSRPEPESPPEPEEREPDVEGESVDAGAVASAPDFEPGPPVTIEAPSATDVESGAEEWEESDVSEVGVHFVDDASARVEEAAAEEASELDLDALVAEVEASATEATRDTDVAEFELSDEGPGTGDADLETLEPAPDGLEEESTVSEAAAAGLPDLEAPEELTRPEERPVSGEVEPVARTEGGEVIPADLTEPREGWELSDELAVGETAPPQELEEAPAPVPEVPAEAGVEIIEPSAPRVLVRRQWSNVLRSRQAWMATAGVVVVAAVIMSLVTFVRTEEGVEEPPVEEVGAEGVAPESPGTEAGDVTGLESQGTVGAPEREAGGGDGEVEAAVASPVGEGERPEAGSPAAGAAGTPLSRARFEELGDEITSAISAFYGLKIRLDEGRVACGELQAAYVRVDALWLKYNVDGRARWEGRLPEDLARRDERIYQGVRDVEGEFGNSGCPRP